MMLCRAQKKGSSLAISRFGSGGDAAMTLSNFGEVFFLLSLSSLFTYGYPNGRKSKVTANRAVHLNRMFTGDQGRNKMFNG